MDNLPPISEAPRRTWVDRVQALFEVFLLSGLISSLLAGMIYYAVQGKRAVGPLNNAKFFSIYLLLESATTFLLLITVLKARRETLAGLGLRRDGWKSQMLLGFALVPFLFLINAAVTNAFRIYLPQYYVEKNPLMELMHTPQQLLLIVFSALIAGGIKEELQRAFILTRFRVYLGGGGMGLVIWSIGFGLGHYVQGLQGVVAATLYGFIVGIIYLLSGSLIAPIIAHGAYDTLALLAYWFYYGRFR